jgi:hypothetical protein
LIVVCAVLAALLGFACAFDQDGAGVSVRAAHGASPSPDEVSGAASVEDLGRLSARPPAKAARRIAPPGLLAAVPGGLCLLI